MGVKAIQTGSPVLIPKEFDTLGNMLLYIASTYPERGITYVDTSGNEQFESYAQLVIQARVYLQQLRLKGIKPGDMLILELDQPREFYKALWACFLGGIIAAPVSQPTSWEPNSPGLLKFSRVWEVLHKPIVIIDESLRARYEGLRQSGVFEELELISTAELQDEHMVEAEVYESKPDDVIFLQFSSGSTGIPKGVQLTNYNIMANNYATKIGLGVEDGDTVFTWLPHTHDMGLFGQHLLPMYCAANIVQFLPYSFIRSPYLFLKKITEHRGKWFCCTNFGFDWMVQKVPDDKLDTLDLSSLRITLNGAEPISTKVIDRFVNKFSRCGYRAEMMFPAYGMAEATVGVSSSVVGMPPVVERLSRKALVEQQLVDKNIDSLASDDITEFVREGYAMPGIEIRIASHCGEVLDEGSIGEIQIRGASVTKGYYNLPEVNEQLFINGWLRTGDLGYMIEGMLVVTGRIKDIVFVRGLNFYAHDLEEVLYDTELIPRGNLAVVGHFNSRLQQEELLVFVKYKADAARFYPIKEALERKLQAALGIDITHVLPIKAIPKTTSGKVQRFVLQTSFDYGEFDEEISKLAAYEAQLKHERRPIIAPRNASEAALRAMWSKVLALPEEQISIEDAFMALGGQSIKAYELLEYIASHYKHEVGAELLVFCKTIAEMAQYIEQLDLVKESSMLEQEATAGEPLNIYRSIAVTGLSLRVPDATTKEKFWSNLTQKVDSIKQVSEERKQLSGYNEWSDWIGELDRIDQFDYRFFDLSKEEASFIDPQQRIAYEVSYEALEEAGVIAQTEEARPIGVYAAINPSSYMNKVVQLMQNKGVKQIHPHAMVGNMSNIVAAKISHLYNFTGPAIAIDTACSSFLVNLHHAVSAIRYGEIEGAVVIGANINVSDDVHQLSNNAGICSSSCQTKVFDKDADGSIIGEGVIAVYIEPLTKAVKDNKHIHGVIRGTAINNDGYSLSIMAPNPKGQYEVLKQAYADAKVAPSQVSYIEAHGSGTTIGDPIEIRALNKWFGNGKLTAEAIGIGSVKSNIGHLFPASSGASLAKVLLALQHKALAPSLHVKEINPALQLNKTPFYIVNDTKRWETTDGQPRIAGISSLGLGGTNAHIVVEEWPHAAMISSDKRAHLITFSAKTSQSLSRLVEQSMAAIDASNWNVEDIAYTRNKARKHYTHRTAYVAVKQDNGNYQWLEPVHGHAINRLKPKVMLLWKEQMGSKLKPNDAANAHAQTSHGQAAIAEAVHPSKQVEQLLQVLHANIQSIEFASELDSLRSRPYLIEETRCDVLIAVNMTDEDMNEIDAGNAIVIRHTTQMDGVSETDAMLLLQQLYVIGIPMKWDELYPHGSGKLLTMPSYSFDHEQCWLDQQ